MSASSWLVTCGIMIQLRASTGPDIFLMRESGSGSIAPLCAKSIFWHGGRPDGRAPGAARGSESARLTNDCTSSRVTRPFGPLPVTVARSTPNSRANLLIEGLACTAPLGATGGAAACAAAGACAAGGVALGVAAAALGAACATASVAVVSVRILAPFETLSPTFTSTDLTTPASGDGTPIDAFSDSSVTSGDSFCTVSPGFTKTSMTGTSVKSPMSGTVTSTVCDAAGCCACGGACGADGGACGADGAAAFACPFGTGCVAAAPSPESVKIGEPSETLSPTLTARSLTTPALGEGTSIEAFSDSSVISGASFSTLSPALTNTSITGTSLKSPMLGTRTSTASATMHEPRPLPGWAYRGRSRIV